MTFNNYLAKIPQKFGLFFITSILLVSATQYILKVDSRLLWFDEIWSADATNHDFAYLKGVIYRTDVHPPLYYGLLYIWQNLAGQSTLAIRFLSVFSAILSTALFYRLGKELLNQSVAFIATTLYLLSDFVFRYSQEARMYMLGIMFVTLTLWLYWRIIKRPTYANGIAFVLAGTAMIYTHYWSLFTIIGLGLYTLIWHRRLLLHFIAIGILYVPWLPVLYHQFTLKNDRDAYIWWALPTNFRGFGDLIEAIIGNPNWLLFILLIGAWWFVYKDKQYRSQIKLLALIVFTQFAIAFSANAVKPLLSPRYMFASVPVFILIVAFTISQLPRYIGMLTFAVLIGVSLLTTHFAPFPETDWIELVRPVVEQTDQDDVIFASVGLDNLPLAYYAQESTNWQSDAYLFGRATLYYEGFGYPKNFADNMFNEHDGIWILVQNWDETDYQAKFDSYGFVQMADIVAPHNRFRMIRFDKIPETTVPIVGFGDMDLMESDITVYDDWVTLNFMWLASQDITENYTVSVFLLNEGGALEEQHDSYPLNGVSPTSTWMDGQYYFDSHAIDIRDLPAGKYQVGIQIYHFLTDDFSQLELISPSSCESDCPFEILETIEIE